MRHIGTRGDQIHESSMDVIKTVFKVTTFRQRQRQVWFIPIADERGVCRCALQVCSRQGAIQIHVYLYLY